MNKRANQYSNNAKPRCPAHRASARIAAGLLHAAAGVGVLMKGRSRERNRNSGGQVPCPGSSCLSASFGVQIQVFVAFYFYSFQAGFHVLVHRTWGSHFMEDNPKLSISF